MKNTAIILATAMLLLNGCTTAFKEPQQVIQVQTSPSGNAVCDLQDNAQSYRVNAPGIVEVNQGDGPLKISCTNGAAKGQAIIAETFNSDALWGEKPGLILDMATGSYQHYPRSITVQMTP